MVPQTAGAAVETVCGVGVVAVGDAGMTPPNWRTVAAEVV